MTQLSYRHNPFCSIKRKRISCQIELTDEEDIESEEKEELNLMRLDIMVYVAEEIGCDTDAPNLEAGLSGVVRSDLEEVSGSLVI